MEGAFAPASQYRADGAEARIVHSAPDGWFKPGAGKRPARMFQGLYRWVPLERIGTWSPSRAARVYLSLPRPTTGRARFPIRVVRPALS